MADDIKHTLDEREATHGSFMRVSEIAQQIKSALSPDKCAHRMTAIQCEAIDMIVSKLARIVCGNPNERDHWHDIAGYATLVERSIPVPPKLLASRTCATCKFGPTTLQCANTITCRAELDGFSGWRKPASAEVKCPACGSVVGPGGIMYADSAGRKVGCGACGGRA